ncbi:MAG: ERAP1-like C-terminal domain-containing protein, partial [Actinomycetota bacterium]|nr:ERAP1-like C-terminal domain-containing protein [Actinomycetota bacterium]
AAAAVDGDPVVVNAGASGFYRVRYGPRLLASLRRSLPGLAAVERAALVDDTWAAVLAGHTPAPELLELAQGFGEETDRTVWATLTGVLGAVEHVLDGEPRRRFRAWVRSLVGAAFERLGWEPAPGEDELTRQLRGILLTAAGVLGDDVEVQTRARRAHGAYLADPSSLDPDVAAAVANVVASKGTAGDHATFLERYRRSPSPQESVRYLYALGRFPDPDLAQQTLAMTLTEAIRSQNAPYVVMRFLGNRDVNDVAWRFVEDNWEAIVARFPDNAIPIMLGGVTALSTPERAAAVQAFLTEHPVPQGQRTVQQHLERLRVNVALRQREAARVAAWLP